MDRICEHDKRINENKQIENLIWVHKDLTILQNEIVSDTIKVFLKDLKEGKYEQLYEAIY